jgi:hypothetical protein
MLPVESTPPLFYSQVRKVATLRADEYLKQVLLPQKSKSGANFFKIVNGLLETHLLFPFATF